MICLCSKNEAVAYDEALDRYYVSESYFNGDRASKYLGTYASEIGKEIDAQYIYESNDTPV